MFTIALRILKSPYLYVSVLSAFIGFGICHTLNPAMKTQTIEKVIEVIVEKKVVDTEELNRLLAVEMSKLEITRNNIEIVEETFKPDGTKTRKIVTDKTIVKTETKEVIKEVIVEKKVVEVVEKSVEKIVEKSVLVEPVLPSYSLGLEVETKPEEITSYKEYDYAPEAGYRVYGNLWLQGTYHWKSGKVGLGFRYEF